MEIIQQIAVKAVEEIFESVKATGLNDIGKTIKALTPVVSRTVLSVLTAFLEEMDESLVIGAKALRREDGITVKERGVSRVWLTELGELTYKRTYFRLRDGSFVYLLDHVIGVESYERISKELVVAFPPTPRARFPAVSCCISSFSCSRWLPTVPFR